MNAITTTENTEVSSQTLEDVLANGDLSKLSAEQRVAFYFQVCKSLGLNPYTRPFDYITLNGKKTLYAKRDATDQLRQIRNITLTVTDKHIEDDLFIVTVRATDAKGRSDEDFGAVPITGLKGEARANAILKGITKAKRRVTLSICGLGMNDESEVATIPGAVTEHLELPHPPNDLREAINDEVSLQVAAASMPRAERVVDPTVYAPPPRPTAPQERTDAQWRVWLDKLRAAGDTLYRREEFVEMASRASVGDAIANGPPWVRAEISAYLAEGYARFPEEEPEADDELPEVKIAGEEKVGAG